MEDKQKLLEQLEQLKEKKKQLETLEQFQDTQQHAYKIFLNSAYGALGSKFYSCYDVDNAMSITKSGQTAIKEMLRYVNEKLKSFADTDIINFVVAGDTDSIAKDSLISVENLYKIYYNNQPIKLVNKNEKLRILRNGIECYCSIDELQESDQIWV